MDEVNNQNQEMEEFYRNCYEKYIEARAKPQKLQEEPGQRDNPVNDDAHCFRFNNQQDIKDASKSEVTSQSPDQCEGYSQSTEDQPLFVGDSTRVIFQNSDAILLLEKWHQLT